MDVRSLISASVVDWKSTAKHKPREREVQKFYKFKKIILLCVPSTLKLFWERVI